MSILDDSMPRYALSLGGVPADFEPVISLGETSSHIDDGQPVSAKDCLLLMANLSTNLPLMGKLCDTIDATFPDSLISIEDFSLTFPDLLQGYSEDETAHIFTAVLYASCIDELKKDSTPRSISQRIAFAPSCDLAWRYMDAYTSEKHEKLITLISGYIQMGIFSDGLYFPYLGSVNGKFCVVDMFIPKNLLHLLSFGLLDLFRSEAPVSRCRNCGRFFFPRNRSDEVYCSRCKPLSYEHKIKADEILSAYRKIYKTQHARLRRNSHIPGLDVRFDNWVRFAKTKVHACQLGLINAEEMQAAISSAEWMKEDRNGDGNEEID